MRTPFSSLSLARAALGWAGLISCVACGSPERVSFAPNGEADLFAVIELDDSGALVGATGILPFARSASVYTGANTAIAIGWRLETLAALGAPTDLASQPLQFATGCVQRLPTAALAVRLGGVGSAVDPNTLPPLTASWLEDACPQVEPADFAFDLECKKFRCPLTVTRRSRCAFDFDLDCNFGVVAGTLHADGSLCLETTPPLSCQENAPESPRAADYTCTAPEVCEVAAYVQSDLPLSVDTLRFLEVLPYIPVPSLIGQLVLPPQASRFFGYAHDFAISGDRAAVSVGPGFPIVGCTDDVTGGSIDVYDLDSMVRTASAAVQGCVARLAPDPEGFVGMRAILGRFQLTRFSRDGRVTLSVPADPRAIAAAGEPPLLYNANTRPTFFDVIGDRLVAAVVVTQPAGTSVFTWDAQTLQPLANAWLADATVVAGAKIDDRTMVLGDANESRVHWFDLSAATVRRLVAFPPEVDREDNFVSDIAWSEGGNRALLTISRKNAAVYGVAETMGVVSRAVVFDRDTRPMATLPWPSGDLALVATTYSTDQIAWPATLSLFDLRTSRFRPGSVPIGHGAPGRMTTDSRGRIWVLLPWDAKLLRVSML